MAQSNSWNPSPIYKFKLHEMRVKGIETDVVLCSRNKMTFRAHKAILVASSPHFDKLFKEDSSSKIINLQDVQQREMKQVLDFIYLDKNALIEFDNMEELEELVRVAMFFQLVDLVQVCCIKAETMATAVDFPIIISMKCSHPNDHVEHLYKMFVKKYWKDILQDKSYLKCELQDFRALVETWSSYSGASRSPQTLTLSSSSMVADESITDSGNYSASYIFSNEDREKGLSAEYIANKIIAWVKESEVERDEYTAELFQFLNTCDLSSPFLSSILHEDVIKYNPDVLVQIVKQRAL